MIDIIEYTIVELNNGERKMCFKGQLINLKDGLYTECEDYNEDYTHKVNSDYNIKKYYNGFSLPHAIEKYNENHIPWDYQK